ncbi:MAG TPA: cytochrome c3 family protein [bacterium]
MMKICKKDDLKESNCWCCAVNVLFVVVVAFLFQANAQDNNNPCFFCHMNVIVEMKAEATKHYEAGINCETCHGASGEHIDVEDNSIKPDSVWTDKNVHLLCKQCHDASLLYYKKSVHAILLVGSNNEKTKKAPSCVTCHGAHGLKADKKIKEVCLECHTPLPNSCEIDSLKKCLQESLMTCKNCHNIHSLELVKKEIPPEPQRRP